ncbi:MAG: hypothetical protein KA297_19795 [Kofleriaceae bacterium]|nr:hypothetical protein [Kofleriaceae bacterium]
MVWMGRHGRVLVVVLAAIGAGCLAGGPTVCADGTVCPAEAVCLVGGGCASQAQDDACLDGAADGSTCEFPGVPAGVCRAGFCVAPRCGDGVVDAGNGESCDAGTGNGNQPDAPCRLDCEPPRCGDGVVDGGEVCDDDNLVSGDGCSGDCASREVCGNEYLDVLAGEECDRGAGLSQDGCSSTCGLEALEWQQVDSVDDRRADAALAYDAGRAEVIRFGGSGVFGAVDETLRWQGDGWQRLRPATAPTARAEHAMVYDAARGQVVLFGGMRSDLGAVNDETWLWDGVTWTQARPVVSPPARRRHALAYDPGRARVVLFGGQDVAGPLADTWEWDGVSWVDATDASPPPARFHHGMAFHPGRQRVVMFGGVGVTSLLRDVREWDGVAWTSRTTTGAPTGGTEFDLAWEPGRARLVATIAIPGQFALATWALAGTTWTQLDATTTPPMLGVSLVGDDARVELVRTGGAEQLGAVADRTSVLVGTTWRERTAAVVTPRYGMQPVFDPARGRLVVVGGAYSDPLGGFYHPFDEHLEYDGERWIERQLVVKPPLGGNLTAGDDHRRRLVLLAADGATWEWDGLAWDERVPAGTGTGPAGWPTGMVYDLQRRQVLLVGSDATAVSPGTTTMTWAWDGAGWVGPTATPGPRPRAGALVVYDPARARVVMFGGSPLDDGDPELLRDTWEWDGSAWTERTGGLAAAAPPPTTTGGGVYDPYRRRVVLFAPPASGGRLIEAWEWDGAAWTSRLAATGPIAGQYGAAFDPLTRRVVLVSGTIDPLNGPVWTYRHGSSARPAEGCKLDGADDDGDGLAGCADPDCYGRCAPACPPGASCPVDAARCGDGACGAGEDYLLCPGDCVAP